MRTENKRVHFSVFYVQASRGVWNKRGDEIVGGTPIPENGSSQPRRGECAIIGSSMRIKGEIHSQEELYIDGEVEGRLESAHALTVGPKGKVQADVKAREVTVLGSVRGNVEVQERIAIRKNGSLIGDIKTAGISIEDGAYFKGSIDISMRPVKQAVAQS